MTPRALTAALVGAAMVILPGASIGAAAPAQPAAAAAAAQPGPRWWRDAMGIDELHRAGATGKGKTVAVLDGHLWPDAPALTGSLISATSYCRRKSEKSYVPTRRTDEARHGTTMAALVTGPDGIAPDAGLRYYQVSHEVTERASGSIGCEDPDIAPPVRSDGIAGALSRAMRDATDKGVNVISISLTTEYSPDVASAVAYALKRGVIVVASVGDAHGRMGPPANLNGVISVVDVDHNVRLGEDIPPTLQAIPRDYDVAAPGVNIEAPAVYGNAYRPDSWSSGSSVSTALVAGGLAAVWSKYPKATAEEILALMMYLPGRTGTKDASGKVGYTHSFRRVNAGTAWGRDGKLGWGVFAPADMVRHDPTGRGGYNPALMSGNTTPTYEEVTGRAPDASIQDRTSVEPDITPTISPARRRSVDPPAPTASATTAASSPQAGSASPSSGAAGTASGTSTSPPQPQASDASSRDGAGVGAGVLLAGGLVALAAAGAAYLLLRRRPAGGRRG